MSEQKQYNPLTADPYPLQRTLGYVVTLWEKDHARVEMPIEERHENVQGFPHGGVYATMMDTALAFCGTWREPGEPPARVMTLSMTLNFLSLPNGKRLIADARKTGGGKSIFFAESTLTDELGTIVATATATMRYRKGWSAPNVAVPEAADSP